MQSDEVMLKRARVRAFMDQHELEGVLLTRQDSFSWYTGGGQNHVATNTEAGVAAILATRDRDYLIANNIESHRLMEEEGLAELEIEPVKFAWDCDPAEVTRQAERILTGRRYTIDTGSLAADLARLRYSLTPFEVERYRALGRDTAEGMAEVCRAVEPGQTEWQVGAMLAGAMWERRIVPVVVLVAADERISRYRHPIPTDNAVHGVVMLVVCGRRHGLIVSTSRLVHFGPLSEALRRKHDAVVRIDAAFIGGTLVGTPVKDVFRKGLDAYEATGFADEWRLHHQGGGTGYATRDFKGTLESAETVEPWQAFAWNPSIAGTKSEDTIIATPDGPEVLSALEDWPSVEVSGQAGPAHRFADILVR